MVIVKDISIFFRSSCCISTSPPPCRNSARVTGGPQLMEYFQLVPSGSLIAATITIGTKFYGSMSSDDQYKHFAKAIKYFKSQIKNIYDPTGRYYFTFELQRNGQLHAHGILYNIYQKVFTDSFRQFGRHNENSKSYQKLNNLTLYTKYINKENAYPPLTNISKKDIINLPKKTEINKGV